MHASPRPPLPASGQDIADWVAANALTASDIDCATAVMLKILDGKCKMGPTEKEVMAALYDAIQGRPGLRLGDDIRALIAQARAMPTEALKEAVYEKRVLAETAISRPVMKAFKAMIRQRGLFEGRGEDGEDEGA